MNAFRVRNHDATVSREQLTDLWRVDCPTCGPVAIGQGYRADAMTIAARHKEAHAPRTSESTAQPEAGGDVATELHGRAHTEHSRLHQRPHERRDHHSLSFQRFH